jgi:hypothetical protein
MIKMGHFLRNVFFNLLLKACVPPTINPNVSVSDTKVRGRAASLPLPLDSLSLPPTKALDAIYLRFFILVFLKLIFKK